MYLWNYHELAKSLKEHKLDSKEKFKYLLAIMLYIPTGLMGSNWIPAIYRLIYRIVNGLVAQQTKYVPPLKVFNDFNYITDILTIIVLGWGIFVCYRANKQGDGRNFIERFMCLSIPISIQVSTFFLLFFLLTLGASLIYFNFKLQFIANIHGFFKGFRKLRHIKELTPIMAYISHRMHVFSCFISIISLIWSFRILRSEIKYIAKG